MDNLETISPQQAATEPVSQKQLVRVAAIAALLGAGQGYGFYSCRDKPEPEEKPCLNCGKSKRHNNSFCSGDCCREYRKRK